MVNPLILGRPFRPFLGISKRLAEVTVFVVDEAIIYELFQRCTETNGVSQRILGHIELSASSVRLVWIKRLELIDITDAIGIVVKHLELRY